MKLIIVTLLVTFTCHNTIIAQQVELLSHARIEFKGNIYDFYESEQIFKEDPVAYNIYLKSKRAKKASKGWGETSLVSLGVGLLLWSSPDIKGYCGGILCLTQAQIIGVLTVYFVFPITGTIGLISHATHKARFKKAVNHFNSNHELGFHQKEAMNLSFGLSQNGIGLVLNF